MTTAWWVLFCGYVFVAGYVIGYAVALWEYDIRHDKPGAVNDSKVSDSKGAY